MKNYAKSFISLTSKDTDLAGGKGASLGEMLNAGIPVPDGFVVLSTTFDAFLSETDLTQEISSILDTVNHDVVHTVEDASEKIQELIKNADFPESMRSEVLTAFDALGSELVAVRSSATAEDGEDHAWAGQLESYMNITRENLANHVQRCWASLFTPRAIFYRFEKGLHDTHISVAVVVQKMVNSEKSGIAFSVHPVTEDPNQMIIEAGFGFGDAIVSGSVTPDAYVVEKDSNKIIDINVNTQTRKLRRRTNDESPDPEWGENVWEELSADDASSQVLSDEDILKLVGVIKTIESHYGKPMDIEWACEGGNFYITQARPITTLGAHQVKPFYTKEFARDFSLPLVQLWSAGESTDPRRWTKKQQPIKPYIIHKRLADTVNCYYDPAGIKWVKNELKGLLELQKDYTTWLLDALGAELDVIQPIYDSPRALSREDLLDFINKTQYAWALFDGMWWLMEVFDESDDKRLEKLVHMRERTNHLSTGGDKVIRESLRLIYPSLGKLSSVLTIEEIRSNATPDIDTLKTRCEDGYVFTQNRLYVGADAISLVENEFSIQVEKDVRDFSGTEISGEIAAKGRVVGIVKRLMGSINNEKVKDGDIIVTSMTMPDMMPAMRKAAAFITDEGGVTCHAAIIARELGKPCIIGTKIATQVLKDGERVEVDAINGVVRKLNTENNLRVFDKHYVRDNALASFGIWHRNQTKLFKETFGWNMTSFVLDATEGVTAVYYETPMFEVLENKVVEVITNQARFKELADEYSSVMDKLEPIWHAKQALNTIKELRHFVDLSVAGWTGMSLGYFAPNIKELPQEYKDLGMKMRERGAEYFEDTDRIMQLSLKTLFPELGELSRYLLLEEAEERRLPEVSQLENRQKHFIFFEDELYINQNVEEWAQNHSLTLNEEKPQENQTRIQGQTAMKGITEGVVRVVMKKSLIDSVQTGEVLVTSMTTPDFLPAMKKAAAFITDEGGVTCHAAIVARELGKPCVIGTKFATQLLKDGDRVQVDADAGEITIL